MPVFLLLLTSLFTGLSVFLAHNEKHLRTMAMIGSTGVAFLSLWIGFPMLTHAPGTLMQGLWYLDPFAGLMLLLIGTIQWTTTMVSLPYLQEEMTDGIVSWKQARLYYALLPLFVFSMLLTVVSNNIGVMWVALEGTTLATTLLVAFYTREGSLEAAWKYILVCSVGIALGSLGMLLVVYAAQQAGVSLHDTLTWTHLRTLAQTFPTQIMRLAFVFIFIGYGAKVGLVPMHTWLPDAHGRTPSPISGLLSGVLLTVALFAILRYKTLVDASLGSSTWTQHFFLVFGALSFLVPAAFMLLQSNYKRLLAYSSIEHMGLIVFAIGLGPLGMAAALLHMIGHAFAKSLLFFATGNMVLRFKSTKIERTGPVMSVLPKTGCLFLLGALALLAFPPSPLFVSEYRIVAAAIQPYPLFIAILLFGGVLIVAGMVRVILVLLYAKKDHKNVETPHAMGEPWNLSHAAMILHVFVLLGVGLFSLHPRAQTLFTRMVDYLL